MTTPFRPFPAALLVLALVSLAPAGVSGAADEAIGVGGYWVIEVRGPDGTPVLRREFHNALTPNNPITAILTGQVTAGPLAVQLDCSGTGCASPCPAGPCMIIESRSLRPASTSVFKNLTVSSGVGGLQLQGSAMASSRTTIARVDTAVVSCAKTVQPAFCTAAAAALSALTSAVLSPGMDVDAGQQILVTVIITAATGTAPPATTPQSVAPSR